MLFSSQVYSEFTFNTEFSQLPSDVVELCKLILLDAVGAAAAATGVMQSSGFITSYARTAFGHGESYLWGCNTAVSPIGAAFANGALSHALNYDVLDAGYAGLIPAAVLAAADCKELTSGQEVLTAMALGIELLTRMQDAASQVLKTYDRMLDGQLQTYFGCAAAAAKVLQLPAHEIDSTLGLALMQAAGTMQITLDGDPEAKAFYGAFPNQCGLQSALLAREGLLASCNAFSGRAGLFPLFYGLPKTDDMLLSGLGQDYRMRRVRFKQWPTSAAFAELMVAASNIRSKERLDPDQISDVQIMTNPTMRSWFEPQAIRRAPTNAAAAGNSAPFAIAVVLANGTFTLADLAPAGLTQPSVARIASRIEAQFDQAVEKPSRLLISTFDGRQFEQFIDPGFSSTTPWLQQDEVRMKFKACLKYASDTSLSAREEEIASSIAQLDQLTDHRDLARILAGKH
jgi:2-methylcitrate dehydratase PrpD